MTTHPFVDRDYLSWPFFEAEHQSLHLAIHLWSEKNLTAIEHVDLDQRCRDIVQHLARDGWLSLAVAGTHYGGKFDVIDTRAVCLMREALAQYDGLADFMFAMQGLGSGAISLFGSEAQKSAYLPAVVHGEKIAAFALSEPHAGSDVAALSCRAERVGDRYRLSGEKTWISNGGIADFYIVFARTDDAPGAKGMSAFIVDSSNPGLQIAERISVMAPHPMARLKLSECFIPVSARLGESGQGFKIAMATLDVFRTSVAGAALGFARRALTCASERAQQRQLFGKTLGDLQLTQSKLAHMVTAIDSAALLTYRAAWMRDQGKNVTLQAAMAKWQASEQAQQIIDQAIQLWGAAGIVQNSTLESLYREIRALRIYEGASEVQQLIIAREWMKRAKQ